MKYLIALMSLFCVSVSCADTACTVFKVIDGDTFHCMANSGVIKVRMADIDAPEKKQPYGLASKYALQNLIAGKTVFLHNTKKDRYKRIVATVHMNGVNVNRQMVENGAAVAYNKNSPYKYAEHTARNHRLGMWQQGYAERPQDFRKRTQPNRKRKKAKKNKFVYVY